MIGMQLRPSINLTMPPLETNNEFANVKSKLRTTEYGIWTVIMCTAL